MAALTAVKKPAICLECAVKEIALKGKQARIQELETQNSILELRNGQLEEDKWKLRLMLSEEPLTGLDSRRIFTSAQRHWHGLVERSPRGNRYCLVLADLNGQKSINDKYGHQEGDRVLVHFAEFLKSGMRSVDYVARFGGDEFAVLLPQTTIKGGGKLIKRLKERMSDELYITVGEEVVRYTASLAVGGYQKGEVTSALFKRVDDALYCAKRRAKQSGKNEVEIC